MSPGLSNRRSFGIKRFLLPAVATGIFFAAANVSAEVPVQRTFFRIPSANGYGAMFLDLSQARPTHFREHSFASEEPQIDGAGNQIWSGNQQLSVATRDLLFDAYFGLRVAGNEAWLTGAPVNLDQSGYAAWSSAKVGGTGVATMVQTSGSIELTEYFFAPRALAHDGFVMAIRAKNTSAEAATGVSLFSLHNLHMGFGRPGALADIDENGETIAFDGSGGKSDFLEQGFAGVVVARALGAIAHHGASNGASDPSANVFQIVAGGGVADLPDLNGVAPTADGSVSAYQWDFGDVPGGEERWAGVVFAHHGDPMGGGAIAEGWLDAYVGQSDAKALVTAEIAAWASFQGQLIAPGDLGADEETLYRQSAAMLEMAQVSEDSIFLRELLSKDGEPRYTRFGEMLGAPKATLPGAIAHRAKGAVLASLPPGEWTVAWARDSAYSAVAMATLGMQAEAKAVLDYELTAEAGRFQDWNELKTYSMPPYQVSLCRYYGFGVEETDENDFGPNLELDGMGLSLWALRRYETLTGDTAVADANWALVSSKIAEVLVALVDPDTGLMRKDSSIWETHWDGQERSWAYTSITAARGLCDAAAIADRLGDSELSKKYKAAGESIRAAIAQHLTDPSHALASNTEELAAGEGYWDAAVLDGIALGLFDPKGAIAKATLAGLDAHLIAPAGAGWSRNDDRYDHANATDLSPWGSEYDSAEWVFTDMRGAIATRLAGDTARSDRLLKWVRDQSLANYLAISETYDEGNGTYKFNAPMVGFGAGAYVLAVAARSKDNAPDPACGAYFDESSMTGAGGGGGSSASGASAAAGAGGSAPGADGSDGGCGCHAGRSSSQAAVLAGLIAAALLFMRRRR